MINTVVGFFNSWTLLINFVCHIFIFISVFYVAVHNRELKPWIITPLWWLALTSGFVCSTIVVQWAIGPEHPMSYWTLGTLGEIASHIILASITFTLFVQTLKQDLNCRKDRK
jgi:FtsH-binding integral membrane protein